MKMGTVNSGKRKYIINTNFFKSWNPKMAYILGFTCADGNLHSRSLTWDLTSKHKSNLILLKSFSKAMGSNYPIKKRKSSYRLRISSTILLIDIKKLGIIPNKKKVLIFPKVPEKYLRHYLRGFLEGDGWITTRIRKNGGNEICVGFSNGSEEFSKALEEIFLEYIKVSSVNLRKRTKITDKGKISTYYQIEFYSHNANKILQFLYGFLKEKDIFLERKYNKALRAMKYFKEQEKINKLGRNFYRIQSNLGTNLIEIMKKDIGDNSIPRELASKLNISLSTLYRWLDKHNIRKMKVRGSQEWSKRIINSRKLVKKNGQ